MYHHSLIMINRIRGVISLPTSELFEPGRLMKTCRLQSLGLKRPLVELQLFFQNLLLLQLFVPIDFASQFVSQNGSSLLL